MLPNQHGRLGEAAQSRNTADKFYLMLKLNAAEVTEEAEVTKRLELSNYSLTFEP